MADDQQELARQVTHAVLQRLLERKGTDTPEYQQFSGTGPAGPDSPDAAKHPTPGCSCQDKKAEFRAEDVQLPSHDPTQPWLPDAEPSFSYDEVVAGKVPIGISARHCHVTPEALEQLFGPGAVLHFDRPLMQMGEYASREKLIVQGPDGRQVKNLRILGPTRNLVQVELAQTDLRQLGMSAPIRPSGTHDGSPGALLIGPAGQFQMTTGVIRANRHLHLHTLHAQALNLKENDILAVHVPGTKPTTMYDVQVRIRDTFRAQLHLDTDDANALDVKNGQPAYIVEKIGP